MLFSLVGLLLEAKSTVFLGVFLLEVELSPREVTAYFQGSLLSADLGTAAVEDFPFVELHVKVSGEFVDDARVSGRPILYDGLFLVIGFDEVYKLLSHVFGPSRLFCSLDFFSGNHLHDGLVRENVVTLVELARCFQTSWLLR